MTVTNNQNTPLVLTCNDSIEKSVEGHFLRGQKRREGGEHLEEPQVTVRKYRGNRSRPVGKLSTSRPTSSIFQPQPQGLTAVQMMNSAQAGTRSTSLSLSQQWYLHTMSMPQPQLFPKVVVRESYRSLPVLL